MKPLVFLFLLLPFGSFGQSEVDTNLFVIEKTFTPNSSQDINGFGPFFHPGLVIQFYEFKIHNRWGQVLFESDHPESNWDCTYQVKKGKAESVPDGTYYWVLTFAISGEDKQTHTGYVTVLR